MLAAIREAAERLKRHKRFDMPGFHPNPYYVRQTQQYGILPQPLAGGQPIDAYATDGAYWESVHYRPAKEPAADPN